MKIEEGDVDDYWLMVMSRFPDGANIFLVLVVLLGLEACLLAQPRTCNGVDATGRYAVSVGQL